MSRRRRQQLDSLELLLDTMCNTFGGIIMIALLIALLSRDTEADPNATQTFRRQLEQLQQQTVEAERLQRDLIKEPDTNVVKAIALLKERDELQRKIAEQKRAIESNAIVQANIAATNDPAELERLVAMKRAHEKESKTLEDQIQKETQAKQRQLRLPKERATGKRTFYFIVRFGRIYPVHLMRDGRRELNRQTLDWSTIAQGETATPRRGAGVDLPNFARLLNEVPSETYSVHFLAYNDSFPLFLAARQVPLARAYDTGWEFLSEDKPIVFSSRGEAPPAL
jgi:hypothetical protein